MKKIVAQTYGTSTSVFKTRKKKLFRKQKHFIFEKVYTMQQF